MFRYLSNVHIPGPTTPAQSAQGSARSTQFAGFLFPDHWSLTTDHYVLRTSLGFSLFAHRLLRESHSFSFPPGTEIFQFPEFPATLRVKYQFSIYNFQSNSNTQCLRYWYIAYWIKIEIWSLIIPCVTWLRHVTKAGVTPFGNRRVTGSWLLTDDYRGHARPSSAQHAKASIVCFIWVAIWFFLLMLKKMLTYSSLFKVQSLACGQKREAWGQIAKSMWANFFAPHASSYVPDCVDSRGVEPLTSTLQM